MNKNRISVRLFILTLVPILGLLGLALLLFRDQVGTAEVIGYLTGAVIPALGFLYQLLERHSAGFFIFTNRVKSLFRTDVMRWSISANFRIEGSSNVVLKKTDDILKATLDEIRRQPRYQSQQIKSTAIQSRLYEVIIPDGPTLRMRLTQDNDDLEAEGVWSIQATIDNYRVGYNQVASVLSREIIPVLEDIARITRSVESDYSLTVAFPQHSNPFFGFFVAQLPANVVSTFNVRLDFSEMKSNVDISMDKLRLNSSSQAAFKDLAVEFLTFSNALGGKLNHA